MDPRRRARRGRNKTFHSDLFWGRIEYMPSYQIHRLKDSHRQQFRWAPHTSGTTIVKPKDYELGTVADGASPYAVWLALRETEQALQVGDLVEIPGGDLRILKYIGFEEARWFVPEPLPQSAPQPEPPVEVT
jgi:hypothetical protein